MTHANQIKINTEISTNAFLSVTKNRMFARGYAGQGVIVLDLISGSRQFESGFVQDSLIEVIQPYHHLVRTLRRPK